ncbi:SRPBCC family protein [Ferrimonas balearica]|uniref:SRPBCC family protein n=1 Tax=Ferrimonas balearica TaxID=44012 RepID=UPI001F2C574F|nr:SRPBCC family protein [Ferrimonas balearica]MBY6095941.1 SRPBCC family protein [Ferrimonas balearica]
MKTLLKLLLVVFLVVLVAGVILPDEFDVRRSVRISATPEQIHPYLNDLTLWPLWSPFYGNEVRISVGRPSAGVGANQTWQDDTGSGELRIVQSAPAVGIQYDLHFNGSPQPMQAGFRYRTQGNDTVVIWEMNGKMQIPVVGAYLAMMADVMIGEQFQQGLERLKRVVEQQPSQESERP